MAGDQTNFAEVATFVLSVALKDGNLMMEDIVSYTYKRTSIKNIEHLAMGEELGLELKNIKEPQIIMQWLKFLGHVGNKSSLN